MVDLLKRYIPMQFQNRIFVLWNNIFKVYFLFTFQLPRQLYCIWNKVKRYFAIDRKNRQMLSCAITILRLSFFVWPPKYRWVWTDYQRQTTISATEGRIMYLSSLLSDMNSEKYLGLYGRQMSNGKAQKNFTFTLLNSGEYMIQPLLKAEFIFSEDVNM